MKRLDSGASCKLLNQINIYLLEYNISVKFRQFSGVSMGAILFFLILLFCPFNNPFLTGATSLQLEEEKENFKKLFTKYAKFYEIPAGVELKEITEEVLNSPYVKEAQKKAIQNVNRGLFVFIYPSDGLKIKGLISFVPNPQNHPLLVFLRGGNRIFGIPNPANQLLCFEQYTVIAPLYRGGVSEGTDEFGGNDVNDVKNLINFISELENKLSISVQNQKTFMLGGSRGGMEMFLSLARFPELQTRFSKIVSLSGLLDLRQCMAFRPEMEEMFIEDFGLIKGVNEEEWIDKRDPLLTADRILPQLPVLIIQGTDDKRVSLEEGHHMVSQLQAAGKNVFYWEFEGADHCLNNIEEREKLILNWLQE
jgi:predicted esterase